MLSEDESHDFWKVRNVFCGTGGYLRQPKCLLYGEHVLHAGSHTQYPALALSSCCLLSLMMLHETDFPFCFWACTKLFLYNCYFKLFFCFHFRCLPWGHCIVMLLHSCLLSLFNYHSCKVYVLMVPDTFYSLLPFKVVSLFLTSSAILLVKGLVITHSLEISYISELSWFSIFMLVWAKLW